MKTETKKTSQHFFAHQISQRTKKSCRDRFDQEAWCIVPRVPASVPPGLPKIRFPPNRLSAKFQGGGCICYG